MFNRERLAEKWLIDSLHKAQVGQRSTESCFAWKEIKMSEQLQQLNLNGDQSPPSSDQSLTSTTQKTSGETTKTDDDVRVPGTGNLEQTGNRGTGWYCSRHRTHLWPVTLMVNGVRYAACEECFLEEVAVLHQSFGDAYDDDEPVAEPLVSEASD